MAVVKGLAASWLVAGSSLTGETDLGTGSARPGVFWGRVLGVNKVAVVEEMTASWLFAGNGMTGSVDLGTGSAGPVVFCV